VAKKSRTPKPPRPAQEGNRRVQAPQRRSGASRPTAPPSLQNRRFWAIGAFLVCVIAVGIAVPLALSGGGKSKPAPLALSKPIGWRDLPGLQTKKPPWPANSALLSQRLGNLKLDPLPQEALAFHIHQHLDLFVDGKKVSIPKWIGIHIDQQNSQASYITEIHTHYPDGIIHVESATQKRYLLGQFFGEWGVQLTSKCLGSFKGSCDNLRWYVNGKRQVGNPADLALKPHQEIAILTGTKSPAKIPSSYSFPSGY
jgi:hypothetical protein